MGEADSLAAGPRASDAVHDPLAPRDEIRERAVDARDGERDMVEHLVVSAEEPTDRRVLAQRLEELHQARAVGKERHADPQRRELLGGALRHPEQRSPPLESVREFRHRNPHMVELHSRSSPSR